MCITDITSTSVAFTTRETRRTHPPRSLTLVLFVHATCEEFSQENGVRMDLITIKYYRRPNRSNRKEEGSPTERRSISSPRSNLSWKERVRLVLLFHRQRFYWLRVKAHGNLRMPQTCDLRSKNSAWSALAGVTAPKTVS